MDYYHYDTSLTTRCSSRKTQRTTCISFVRILLVAVTRIDDEIIWWVDFVQDTEWSTAIIPLGGHCIAFYCLVGQSADSRRQNRKAAVIIAYIVIAADSPLLPRPASQAEWMSWAVVAQQGGNKSCTKKNGDQIHPSFEPFFCASWVDILPSPLHTNNTFCPMTWRYEQHASFYTKIQEQAV